MEQQYQPEDRFQRWEHWLSNVFWFHYKLYYIAALFFATILLTTLFSAIFREKTDLSLIYVHSPAEETSAAEPIRSLFARYAETERRGGARVAVDPVELETKEGERPLYGELELSDNILYLLDGDSLEFCRALGFFEEADYLPSLGLWVSVRDVPVIPYLLEDFQDQGYTQEQVDESNAYREEEHRKQVQAARALVDTLASLG